MTYSKTPSSKGLSDLQLKEHCKALGKDSVTVEIRDNGKYRLNLARRYSRMYYQASSNKRFDTKLSVLNSNGKLDRANADAIAAIVTEMHNDLTYGHFERELYKYGLKERPALTAIDGGKSRPQMSMLEIWDMYCEYKQKGKSISVTTLELEFKKKYRNAIKEAINNVGENDALAIRSHLLDNRCENTAKNCLGHLSKAYQLGIKHKNAESNPFDGMAEEINPEKKTNNENDDKRAFSVDEMNAIIEAFETSKSRQHFAPIIKFLFWTGCRTGEAIGLQWRHVKWDKELIVFNETYNYRLKIFKDTKTGNSRFLPMPKNGQLWNLLKSLPERDLEDVVFTSKTGKMICSTNLGNTWRGNCRGYSGVIPELIEQGKVSQYLKLYATRHTFVTYQKYVCKVDENVIAAWVGHDVEISRKSYLDRDRITVPGNPNEPKQQATNNQNDQIEELKKQIEELKTRLN